MFEVSLGLRLMGLILSEGGIPTTVLFLRKGLGMSVFTLLPLSVHTSC